MTQVSIDKVDAGNSPHYETPTFNPRGAFATTLRAGEIALRERRQRQNALAEPTEQESKHTVKQVTQPARRYETPTFHPRSAFARTLRSGEIALLERRQRLAVLVPAS